MPGEQDVSVENWLVRIVPHASGFGLPRMDSGSVSGVSEEESIFRGHLDNVEYVLVTCPTAGPFLGSYGVFPSMHSQRMTDNLYWRPNKTCKWSAWKR